MTLNLNQFLGEIVNPISNISLSEEKRIKNILEKDSEIVITYDREGLSPENKRILEDLILEQLSKEFDLKNVYFKTISQDSKDVYAGSKKSPSVPVHDPKKAELPKKKMVPNVSHIVAVSSGKGGVGKSTVSANLAISLKRKGYKVGLIDADVYGPSIPMLLGKREEKPRASENKKIIPIEAFGIHFMSFVLFVPEGDPVIWRGPMLGGVLNQFLFDVEWGELDYLLIDLPPGTGDMQLSMIQTVEIDGALVVSTPQDVALLDSKKGLQMFHKMNVPVLGMIENMSYFSPPNSEEKYYLFGKEGVENAAKSLNVDFLGGIPLEVELRESSDKGMPYMENNEYEGRGVWNSYMEIVEKLVKKLEEKRPKSFFQKIFS